MPRCLTAPLLLLFVLSAPFTACAARLRPYRRHANHTASVKRLGPTAVCRDGSLSWSTSTRGTCSRHGGVGKWQ